MAVKKQLSNSKNKLSKSKVEKQLYLQIALLIEESKQQVYKTINTQLTLLYWHIGKNLYQSLKNYDSSYGQNILATVSQELTNNFGKGYSASALSRMLIFYNTFSNLKILATLSHNLSWSHFIELITVKDNTARLYYTELCRNENWSVRQLRGRIDSMLFERTAISKKPQKLIKEELAKLRQKGITHPDIVFRDKYLFDFLNLKDSYSENDLETAILIEIQNFILEVGSDFAFLGRQKRIIIDKEDYYIDLLFYHRGLNRLVAIELKLGKFKPMHKAQMELYLKWLERYEMKTNEELPIGLILCADKAEEVVELLMLDNNRIRVAQYLTALPPIKLLKQKLAKAVKSAKNQLFQKAQQQLYK
jgi:predicted nuclease of restriction endonuclease-like (RecB) superfamily